MKTAIVTGGTRGIGLGIARSLARDGYNLVLGYHTNQEAAQRTKDAIEKEFGVQVRCVGGDIALPETMEKLFEAIRTEFNNELTAFVHNAGLYVGVTTESTDIQPKPPMISKQPSTTIKKSIPVHSNEASNWPRLQRPSLCRCRVQSRL